MGTLIGWDISLLRAINLGWACPVADTFFVFITHLENFTLPIAILAFWWIFKGGRKGRYLVAALVLTVAVTDPLSSRLVKNVVDRERPCRTLTDLRTPDGCGPAQSFPSSHASNIGGAMTLVALTFPAWTPVAVLIALAVGLSRIYLGVHYPSDVLGGYLLGFLCALVVWRLKGWVEGKAAPTPVFKANAKESKNP